MGLSISISSSEPTSTPIIKGNHENTPIRTVAGYLMYDDIMQPCKNMTSFDGMTHSDPDDTTKEIIIRAGLLVDGPNGSKNTELRITFPDDFISTPFDTPYTVFMKCENIYGVSVQHSHVRRLDHICDANVVINAAKQAV